MDTTKTIAMPSMLCLTLLFIIYYRFSRKSKKDSNKSKVEIKPEEIHEDDNKEELNKKSEEEENEEVKEEQEEKEEKEDNEEKEEKEEKEEEKEDNDEQEEQEEENEEEIQNWKMTSNMLFDKFCEYIQKNKLVSVDAIAEKLNKSKEDTIKFLRELEKEGKTQGFLGDDGEYFFLTMKELELLNNILIKSKKKRIKEEELQEQFDEIIKERDELLF